jgi:mannose-6-phosphate isomerase
MKFLPVYKDYPWGGSRIPETYHRDVPPGIYAESWEIADHDDGMSVVANGSLAGHTLRGILQANPGGIMGTRVAGSRFPLLIKLIDAKQKLSVQIHPDDATALKHGGNAKTEAWYLLGDNDAVVYCGLKEGTTYEGFKHAIANGTTGETLRPVPVENGSVVFVRGGCVHAIEAGCFILEIQQNSNTTYRIHDWGRMGNDGKPRALHIEQAVHAIHWNDRFNPQVEPKLKTKTEAFQLWELLRCEYFCMEKLVMNRSHETSLTGETFHALFVADGEATLSWEGGSETLKAGESILVPAALPAYALEGKSTILRTFIPTC